jgi:phage major head subunit gpT-like protein
MATAGTYATLDNRNLKELFRNNYEGAVNAGFASKIGMLIPSDSATETYGWLGAAPALEELLAEAKAQEGMKQFSYTLTNKEYAKAISIAEKDLRRDKLGQLEIRMQEFAAKAAEHWDALVASLIVTVGNSYDGTTFFSATHAESGSNQVNALTNSHIGDLNVTTATDPTADEMAKIIPQVIGKFHGLTDDKGDPINGSAREFVILCGTANIWGPTLHALKANNLTSGASNPVVSVQADGYRITTILAPRLASLTTSFYVFRTDSVVKPFILQEEVPLDFQMTDNNSDEYKKYRRYTTSIYTSRAAGYGRWQSAMKATLS